MISGDLYSHPDNNTTITTDNGLIACVTWNVRGKKVK